MEVVKGQKQSLSEPLIESELQKSSFERISSWQASGQRQGNNLTDPLQALGHTVLQIQL